jgi:hypothetical protein
MTVAFCSEFSTHRQIPPLGNQKTTFPRRPIARVCLLLIAREPLGVGIRRLDEGQHHTTMCQQGSRGGTASIGLPATPPGSKLHRAKCGLAEIRDLSLHPCRLENHTAAPITNNTAVRTLTPVRQSVCQWRSRTSSLPTTTVIHSSTTLHTTPRSTNQSGRRGIGDRPHTQLARRSVELLRSPDGRRWNGAFIAAGVLSQRLRR